MRYANIVAPAILASMLGIAAPADEPGNDAEGWVDVLRREQARDGVFPLLAGVVPAFDLELAYDIQRALVAFETPRRQIGGYKGGFTGETARRRFGLDGPVSGVLFADGSLRDGARLSLRHFHQLMVEIEIGFVLRSPIRRPMKSIEDLRTYVRAAVPAVELPDLRYADMKTITGLDIVATNMGAAHYLVGEPLPLSRFEQVNALEVVLYRDGEVIDSGRGDAAMGNQLQALFWLVNHLHDAGWPLEPGHVLLTGTLGRINAAEAGTFRADYGDRASVEFVIDP